MTRTILIPTDLRIASLNTLKIALEQDHNVPPKVLLMYAEYLTDSISDLIFYSPDKILNTRIPGTFREAVEILKNRFEHKMNGISIKLFHGYTRHALHNFLDGHHVDHVFIPKTYRFKTPGRAFDPVPVLRKMTVPVTEISWDTINTNGTEQDLLLSLFN